MIVESSESIFSVYASLKRDLLTVISLSLVLTLFLAEPKPGNCGHLCEFSLPMNFEHPWEKPLNFWGFSSRLTNPQTDLPFFSPGVSFSLKMTYA